MAKKHEFITSMSNPVVKRARALRRRKVRDETGLFTVEGIHLVGEAIEAGWEVELLLYAPDLIESIYARRLIDRQTEFGMRCQPVSSEVFGSIAEKENPQGILAVVHQRESTLEHLLLDGFLWGAALFSPQDLGNVGAVLRTVDAVGADGLILLEKGVDPYHPSAVRASMGAMFWKPIVSASFREFVQWVNRCGYRLIGSSAHAQTHYAILREEAGKTIILLGSEQKGLTDEQLAACTSVVNIPMHGKSSSLNLAVAAGILLYALSENKFES